MALPMRDLDESPQSNQLKRKYFHPSSFSSLSHRLPSPSPSDPSRALQPVVSPTPRRPLPSGVPLVNGFSGSANDDLRIPLREIVLATNNFGQQNLIDKDEFEEVYKAQLFRSGQLVNVVVQRLGHRHMFYWKDRDYLLRNICRLSGLKNKNMVSIVGFCYENDEVIIINEHVVNGSLDKHLPYPTLTWIQRLHICVSLAQAIGRDTDGMSRHCNIKSSKILLDKDWEPKLFDISSRSNRDLVQNFGVLLSEVLCDRKKMMIDGVRNRNLVYHYVRGIMDEIIDHNLRKQMHPQSLTIFSKTAINCLTEQRKKRHTIDDILRELEKALELQLEHENAAVATPTFSWKFFGMLED